MAPGEEDTPKLYSKNGLTRWYIDTRGLTARTPTLPLLDTLQPSEQKSIQNYYRLSDRHMSLASNLLKYFFIHQTCHVPWNQILISRTPAPHKRPCYIPARRGDDTAETTNIEFNVSHQASMVALAGCILTPDTSLPISLSPDTVTTNPNANTPSKSQIGIDITCTDERERRNADSIPKTEAELHDFVDIFYEVFSAREIANIKTHIPTRTRTQISIDSWNGLNDHSINDRLRRFYTYWALKEAYIKMTGEALLAPWLRELEFVDVVAPDPPAGDGEGFGEPYTRTKILLHGQEVNDVRIEVVALGEGYIFATAARGHVVGNGRDEEAESTVDSWELFRAIDIERDIGPCATGHCSCLT